MKSDRRQSVLLKLWLAMLLLLAMLCQAHAEQLYFTVLHTSDEHSSLQPVPLINYRPGEPDQASGGFARLATLINNIREQKRGTPVLLFSSGDFIGGTPFSWLILKNHSPELEIMHRLNYSAATLGNHEFDYGSQGLADYFNRLQDQHKLPTIIASNLIAPDNHAISRTKISEHQLMHLGNGLRVGVFALLGKGAYRVSPDAKPLSFADQHTTAREKVAWLNKSGAQVIIALTHFGINEDRELAAAVPGIHLILGGHDHLQFKEPEMASGTLIMHSGYYTQNLGQLDLAWDTDKQTLQLCNKQTAAPILHHIDSSITEDPEISAIVDEYRQQLNEFIASFTGNVFTDVSHIIARSDFELKCVTPFAESTVGNFVTDAMRIESEKVTGEKVDFAIQANGTIRGDLLTGSDAHAAGKISFFDLISVSAMGSGPDGEPGYPLVSLYLTGQEVYRLLEIATLLPELWGDVYFLQFSGLRYTYDPDRIFWSRKAPFINKPLPTQRSVTSAEMLKYAGNAVKVATYEPIDTSSGRLYHLVTTRYLATYLPMIGSRLPALKLTIKNRLGKQISIDEAIIRDKGREFKIWEATARYAASFAKGTDGLPVFPDRYRTTEGRIKTGKGTWLWLWPLIATLVAGCLFVAILLYLLRRRKKQRQPD
ncbi:MAG: hypothetical protein CVV41_06985 [Candidatus Riflebacteria bacterium HGW-Riflebacteria-1]|jgi:2',3'-cyclic-nucleotide 2'-phosphodiesterase (5'-nucleotidase family)|nr:MAG: hypothetical protein CVV41_06985 [Candidatus Riflebacteria bacterium HGW-Riflebacteria-1]